MISLDFLKLTDAVHKKEINVLIFDEVKEEKKRSTFLSREEVRERTSLTTERKNLTRGTNTVKNTIAEVEPHLAIWEEDATEEMDNCPTMEDPKGRRIFLKDYCTKCLKAMDGGHRCRPEPIKNCFYCGVDTQPHFNLHCSPTSAPPTAPTSQKKKEASRRYLEKPSWIKISNIVNLIEEHEQTVEMCEELRTS
ncbi:hypothetical protein B9Z55_025914 [Caenorhabditis nigoni]|uniref:Uncharacterized protein n=1 Tax=Caenorhabditis nigoni TaxID=1611254 RepID=A0A2G5T0S6_9PELO|nr:hypothetical protein B9Z55_025914 [Caenorhabditis nigoni]